MSASGKKFVSDSIGSMETLPANAVGEIVIGIPISMSGRRGPQVRRTLDFAELLAQQTDLPIKQVDERLSSVQAERMMIESGASPSRDKARVDAVAAAVILQAYLDSK